MNEPAAPFMMPRLRVLVGSGTRALGEKILGELDVHPDEEDVISTHADGEPLIELGEVRNAHVFVVCSTHMPAHNFLELLLLIDAARRSGARQITAVVPYFGLAREDTLKDDKRNPVSAKVAAKMIQTAGADCVAILDPHSRQLLGFFDITPEQVYARPVMIEEVFRRTPRPFTLVAPDAGATQMVLSYAKRLGIEDIAIFEKHRSGPGEIEQVFFFGEIDGKDAFILDDMIDTAGTVVSDASELEQRGAKHIRVAAIHGLFSGEAVQRIIDSPIEEIWITDTVPLRDEVVERLGERVHVVSVGRFLGRVIRQIYRGGSVSKLIK